MAAWAKGNAWTSVIACWTQFNERSLEEAEPEMGHPNSKARRRGP
jgi:hypothetical protein